MIVTVSGVDRNGAFYVFIYSDPVVAAVGFDKECFGVFSFSRQRVTFPVDICRNLIVTAQANVNAVVFVTRVYR